MLTLGILACNKNEPITMMSEEDSALLKQIRAIQPQNNPGARSSNLGNPENNQNPWDAMGSQQEVYLKAFRDHLEKMVVYECKSGLNGPVLNAKENAAAVYYEDKTECTFQKMSVTSRPDTTKADLTVPENKLLNSLDSSFYSKTNCPINGGYLQEKATEANFFSFMLEKTGQSSIQVCDLRPLGTTLFDKNWLKTDSLIQDQLGKGRISVFEQQFLLTYFDKMEQWTDQAHVFLNWSRAAENQIQASNHLTANQKERIFKMTALARYTWYHFQEANDDPNSIWWKFHRLPMNPRDAIIPHLCLASMLGYLDGKSIQSETITAVVYVGVVILVGDRLPCACTSGISCYVSDPNNPEISTCVPKGCCCNCWKGSFITHIDDIN